MEEVLQHPAVQSAVLPFVVALALSAVLFRTRLLGAAIIAGFLCAAGLTVGFGFESLTSVRKLVLVAGVSAVVAAVLEPLAIRNRRAFLGAVAAFTVLAVIWVLQRLLMQATPASAVLTGAVSISYCFALLWGADHAGHEPVAAASSSLVIGLACGALALLGASAQLAQLGIALGAGAGAVLLVLMMAGARAPGGSTLGLAAHLAAGVLGLLAVMTGSLAWYCLLPVPLIPWLATVAIRAVRLAWQRAALSSLSALVPAAAAVAIAWFTAGHAGA
ncbi:MAG TPA: hypothetical protein VLJ57_09685 [Burkholderiaceae bacterium]|nr:hypothetical protein [Burkholderiaceae bacterium]